MIKLNLREGNRFLRAQVKPKNPQINVGDLVSSKAFILFQLLLQQPLAFQRLL